MLGDELAAELLTSVLHANPIIGSLYGFSGYDAHLPDFSGESQSGHARQLASIAARAEQAPDAGLAETDVQTLDFVRCLARGMADAAAVPIIEFTISDTFAAPVGEVLSSLPKIRSTPKSDATGTSPGCAASRACSKRWPSAIRMGRARGVRRWPGSWRRPSPSST